MSDFFIKYGAILYLIQLVFAIIIGMYFWNLLKNQQSRRTVIVREAEKEINKLKHMRKIKLTEPLSSLTRPTDLSEVGQREH